VGIVTPANYLLRLDWASPHFNEASMEVGDIDARVSGEVAQRIKIMRNLPDSGGVVGFGSSNKHILFRGRELTFGS